MSLRRTWMLAVCVCGAVAILPGSATAQTNVLKEAVTTADQQQIRFSYYPALKDKGVPQEAPVAILLHGAGGSRIVWDKGSAPPGGKSFPETLQNEGFAVLTVDLRKHGESVTAGRDEKIFPDDYAKMSRGDLVAIKDFLKAEHQKKLLNMSKIGIVAADMSCPVAADFAEYDWRLTPYADAPVYENRTPRGQDVRALVLLSPDTVSGRLQTSRSMNYLRDPQLGIALLVISGKKDAQDKGASKKIYDLFKGKMESSVERVYISDPDLKNRGTDLLLKAPNLVETPILKFLVKHVKDLVVPWRDRRSKLEL